MINDELKTIKTEFETILNSDKIYRQTSRAISKLIRTIPTELKLISQSDSDQKAHFSSRLDVINQNYQLHIDNFEKSIAIINTKNETEIKKIKRQRNSKIDKITKLFNQQADNINKRREKVDLEYEQALKEVETIYQRDLGSYQKVAQSARKLNQKVTFEIEKEQQQALEGLKTTFDATTAARETAKQLLVADFETKKKEIDDRKSETTTINNDVYLAIKTNYNEFSMIFNKKINELNKENQNALKTIKERFENKKRPIDALLVKLKEDYKAATERLKTSYQDELTQMNEDFDLKKKQYEEKKERIIHESNEVISLLNSKLTAYKESVHRENQESAKIIRGKMKSSLDEHEQVDLQKELRSNLKNVNNDLNKQIIRTNREISSKQRDFQYRLYNHDLAYLKTLNDWRLEKNLASYRHKQSLTKIELNFNHNIAQSKAQLATNDAIFKHQEQLLELSLNRDLLTLETQLQIASIVQERELNLLTNDQQIAINLSKLEHAKLEYDHQLALENLDFAQKQEALHYEYNKLTVSSNTQLELEKARSKRDFSLEEQQIRGEIAKKIYDRSAHNLNIDKQSAMLEIEHDMKSLQMAQDNDAFHIDMTHRDLMHKRISFMMKAAIKNQKRVGLENTKRRSLIEYESLLDYQYHTVQLLKYLFSLNDNRLIIRNLINELYLLPSHPETFKEALLYAMRFDHEIDKAMQEYISSYELRSRELFKAKIENPKDYRYVLKHKEMMKFYKGKTKRLDREQKVLESEIQNIEHDYIKYQSDIDQNKAFIDQLMKINEQIKSGLLPLQSSYDYKENTKLIKNHQNVITHLKDNMKRSDRLIDIKHREINALAKEQTSVQKQMENLTKHLTREKQLESQLYLKHLVKHDKHYKVISKRLSTFTHHSQAFYSELKDLVYVTNESLDIAFKKLKTHRNQFEKYLILTEQRLFEDARQYYQESISLEQYFEKLITHQASHYLGEVNHTTVTFMHDQEKTEKMHKTTMEKQQRAILRDETHQREILHLNKEKTIHADLAAIKQLESKLDLHLLHSESELNALNENQQAIIHQYVKESEQKLEGYLKEHQKHINFFKTRFTNTSSDLDSSNQTLTNKNQVLLIRYAAQRAKSIENMTAKRVHFESQINHHHDDILRVTEAHKKDALFKDKKRQDELKNIQNHLRRFEQQAESNQKLTLNKEANALKRNLTFKLKALKLN